MKKLAAAGAVLLVCMGVDACAPTPTKLAPGKTPQQAAMINEQLAIEYMRLDKLTTAREFAERALNQDPHGANAQMTAGLVYERLEETGRADHAFEAAARYGKNDPNIQNNYAGYLCRRHRADEGEALFLKVIHNPAYQTPEVAYLNAGVCLRGTNDLAAENYFRQALMIRPTMPEALLQLGDLVFEKGDTEQAVLIVQRYLRANPANPDILWLGVKAQRKLGDEASAADYVRRLQKEFPDSQQARALQSAPPR
ncbi:MAG: type IV pilus biogenesis/stability protein PilW [Steroidobacterales bacterium]